MGFLFSSSTSSFFSSLFLKMFIDPSHKYGSVRDGGPDITTFWPRYKII